MCYLLLAVFLVSLILLSYCYLTWNFNYWKNQGVRSAPNTIPGFGNTLSVLTLKENLSTVCNRLYKSCLPETSMIGMYFMRTPLLVVRDPDLIRNVLVKDFKSFKNNALRLHDDYDPFMKKNPFFDRDESWKDSRSHLVRNMSQKKLKIYQSILDQVSSDFIEYLNQERRQSTAEDMELKDLFLRVTGEIVASTSLGIKGHSFESDHDLNNFHSTLLQLSQPSFLSGLTQMLRLNLPNIADIFHISLLPRKMSEFLQNIIEEVVRCRAEHNIVGEDFLQMVINDVKVCDPQTIADRVGAYFFDSFETSASIAAFACNQLSNHPDIQEKLRQEIKIVLKNCDSENLTYEALKDMVFLDQVISETIRLHPILGITIRDCTEDVTLHGSDGQKCVIKVGHLVCIPVDSLHRDQKYWEDPEKFNPDRFNEENKKKIVKFAYLPFSEGPRACAGKNYGTMIVKNIIVKMLMKYRILPSKKMSKPLEYNQMNFLTEAKDGLWVKVERII
ncbi:hypothetical protein QAD02_010209 [Eretmocerus hayati]|uniref:Uncharacterized protein n=1 Tax=Eretmocerus hayati TaxID=131215 RepID=A0ACC2ND04_9HYME|nr:hypothetical protein QAD02_010209 [Eretmocerus hayati]